MFNWLPDFAFRLALNLVTAYYFGYVVHFPLGPMLFYHVKIDKSMIFIVLAKFLQYFCYAKHTSCYVRWNNSCPCCQTFFDLYLCISYALFSSLIF